MRSSPWIFAAAMSVAGLALAQTAPGSGVTETTDPAKISAIEHHAQELASHRASAAMPAGGEHMKKHGMRHHKSKPMHKRATKDKPASDTPVATDSKG